MQLARTKKEQKKILERIFIIHLHQGTNWISLVVTVSFSATQTKKCVRNAIK